MLTRLINGDLLLHFTPSQQSNNIHYKPQLDPLATALESISERADRAISTGPTTTERRSSGQPHRPKSSSQTPLSPPQASQRGLVLAKKKDGGLGPCRCSVLEVETRCRRDQCAADAGTAHSLSDGDWAQEEFDRQR
jgi:hypothetical protein